MEILFPLMRWRMKTPPNTEQYARGGRRGGGEGRGGGGGRGSPYNQGEEPKADTLQYGAKAQIWVVKGLGTAMVPQPRPHPSPNSDSPESGMGA